MLWFQGSISDAIQSAKQRSLIFVVVITGEDEQSTQLVSSWEDDTVSEAALSSCVAIKVDSKSEACVQFSQIYPVVCIPSSFFIGDNGIPLEVIAGSVSSQDLTQRINRVTQMHAHPIGHATVMPAPSVAMETSSHTSTESAAATETLPSAVSGNPQASLTSLEDDHRASATVGLSENASLDAAAAVNDDNLEAKVERLNKKLEEKREEKKKGEEENQIQKEMERRKVGRGMQDFKRKQEDDKTKRLLEERNKEKAEEKAARERVKLQIAMDRADRAARYAKTQEEEKAAKEALLQVRQAEQEARKEIMLRQRSTIARIQFRLPDGSSLTNQFSSQSTLQEARQFAAQEVGNRYGNFSLATMFPRREFTDDDLNKTLLELELAPSASIVLLPYSGRAANTVVQSSGGGIWAVLSTVFYPLLAVWRFLSAFLFTGPPPSRPAPQGPSSQSSSYSSSSAASDKAKRENQSKQTLDKQPKGFKKDGKICSLRTQEDSEDDTNTWNGNSTQQM